ncbi:stress-inducible protein [Streptomyces sp. Ru71]|uniref:universal stress protein n=1 Tax=Streptomyces sp. Ru71 TaxID=2080746 RepID=UPI000CDE1C3E|nr:universal stress protein [Streptomyces sp. Ru71]POX52564.1 stress-inducible protein [Streptomyces sp. Ru71]
MIRSVVAGVDGSREGFAAADWAAREALRRGVPLRLVHAWEGGLPEGGTEFSLPELRAPQQHARRVLHGALGQLGRRYPRLAVSAEQVAGPPVSALLGEAENADLLVIGSQGSSGLSGFVSGAVAMATAARMERPIVLVRADETAESEHLPDSDGRPSVRTPLRDVTVAVDVDGTYEEVLDFAFRAAELRGAPLRAVHAWHVPYAEGGPAAAHRARTRAAAEQELERLLEPWRRKHPAVAVRENLHEGRPAHVLVRATGGAGLVVAGIRRRRTEGRPHTGPVPHALIHHVRCPVALVSHE